MKELESFRKAIAPYRDGWSSIDIRSVSFLAYGKWINLGTRILLSQEVRTAPTDLGMLPSMDGLCALHETKGIAELDSLLAQIATGVLMVSDQEIHFGIIEANEVKVGSPNFQFQQARRGTPYFQGEYPYLSLVHWGQGFHNLLHNHEQAPTQDELDWKLRSQMTPYNGLEDLLIHCLGVPRSTYTGTPSTLLELVAPLGVRLGQKSILSKGKLTVQVESSGAKNPEGVSLGVIALAGISPINRITRELAKDDWDGSTGTGYKQLLIESSSSAVISLSFKGHAIDIQTVNDPTALPKNPRVLADLPPEN